MNVFRDTLTELDSLMDSAQMIIDKYKPVDEKLELLKDIQEYYYRKENQSLVSSHELHELNIKS